MIFFCAFLKGKMEEKSSFSMKNQLFMRVLSGILAYRIKKFGYESESSRFGVEMLSHRHTEQDGERARIEMKAET